MKRFLVGLLLLALPAVAWSQDFYLQPLNASYRLRWQAHAGVYRDTTGFYTAGAEDTTEVINARDIAWQGCAAGIGTSATSIAVVTLECTYTTAAAPDSFYATFEGSPDGQTWEHMPSKVGLAQATAGGWRSPVATEQNVEMTVIPLQTKSNELWQSAGASIGYPFLRLRVQKGSAANAFPGVKAYLRYYRIEGR